MENMVREIIRRLNYWKGANRIGPDIPTTHWKLYFKSTMLSLCKKKFMDFDDSSEFRPGAYAINSSNISIGKSVTIRPGTMLFGSSDEKAKIIIEDGVLMGSGVHIYVTRHSFEDPNVPIIDQGFSEPRSVILKKGCWIGANSIILPGVTIGENSVIGAGSIVTKSVNARSVAVGNPCRIIREI
jgi:Acetyltransferase (isoleucine patch superfamily)